MRHTRRRFDVNLQRKRYWVPSLNRHVTLRVSTRGIKVIDARGIDTVARDIIARGEKILNLLLFAALTHTKNIYFVTHFAEAVFLCNFFCPAFNRRSFNGDS